VAIVSWSSCWLDHFSFATGFQQWSKQMKRIALAATISLFAVSAAMAQDATCAAKAVGSDGKKLAGAAKVSFMKKCEAGA
jgi:predicted YcjX-like family ATPase